jgi:hypothetical protein
MMQRAVGTFEVQMTPQDSPDPDEVGGVGLARFSLDKKFAGALTGTSRGAMLSAGSASGSGAYVAIERVRGTLDGRSGSFVLHHRGVMTKGSPELAISVVPDSGTGELAGLSGKMAIEIAGGKHSYELEYSLE